MNQQLRTWYLSTLGITQYVAKGAGNLIVGEDVVGTGSSAVNQLSAASAANEAVTSADSVGLAEGKRKPRPKITIELDTPRVVEPEVSVPLVDSIPAAVSKSIQFRLACWQPSDDLLVVDSLNPGEQPGAERVQLLTNILRAVKRMPEALGQAELLDWPVSANGQSDENGARALLSVFLDARIKQRGVCWVLLMGEIAAAYIGDADTTGDTDTGFTVGERRELSGGAKAILTHSLKTMLDKPACKAETWQAIRFLVEV